MICYVVCTCGLYMQCDDLLCVDGNCDVLMVIDLLCVDENCVD